MVKGLVHVLEALQGDTVTIELKNGSVVVGTLANVDQQMNTHLSGAKVTPVKGEPEVHDEFTVRGMNVRQILLGETTDLDDLLRKAAANEKRAANANKNNAKFGAGAKAGGFGAGSGKGKSAPKIAGKIRQRDE